MIWLCQNRFFSEWLASVVGQTLPNAILPNAITSQPINIFCQNPATLCTRVLT